MADDTYKLLLAAASHSHLQRHAQQQERLVGNVFLPSIQRRSAPHAALSLKHLQVIEQCIIAENRREAQLSQCASEKERRFLSRRFQAQRDHERDLIEALMLGQPAEQELQIVDVQREATVRAGRVSPLSRAVTRSRRAGPPNPALASANAKAATVGVQFSVDGPDKVFRKPSASASTSPKRARARAPTTTKPPQAEGEEDAEEAPRDDRVVLLPSCSPSKRSANVDGPRKSASAAASPPRSPAKSPQLHRKPPQRLPAALATSPLRASLSPQSSPSKHKLRKASLPSRSTLTVAPEPEPTTVSFDGATSFLEARACAMEIVQAQRGLVEGGTQTTARCDAVQLPDSSDMVLVLAQKTVATSGGETAMTRPHTSPERRRRPSQKDLPSVGLGHSGSGSALTEIEYFRLIRDTDPLLRQQLQRKEIPTEQCGDSESDARSRSVATFVSEDSPSKRIHVVPKESLPSVLRQELAWPEHSDDTDADPLWQQQQQQSLGGSDQSSHWADPCYDSSATGGWSESYVHERDVSLVDLDDSSIGVDTTGEEVAAVLAELVEMAEIVHEEEQDTTSAELRSLAVRQHRSIDLSDELSYGTLTHSLNSSLSLSLVRNKRGRWCASSLRSEDISAEERSASRCTRRRSIAACLARCPARRRDKRGGTRTRRRAWRTTLW
ncbi:hypothetical protein PINS_up011896 [Pythium insidiosum]|nr:hypothetical protein PINS_up011896 [Pythium insidiosum]